MTYGKGTAATPDKAMPKQAGSSSWWLEPQRRHPAIVRNCKSWPSGHSDTKPQRGDFNQGLNVYKIKIKIQWLKSYSTIKICQRKFQANKIMLWPSIWKKSWNICMLWALCTCVYMQVTIQCEKTCDGFLVRYLIIPLAKEDTMVANACSSGFSEPFWLTCKKLKITWLSLSLFKRREWHQQNGRLGRSKSCSLTKTLKKPEAVWLRPTVYEPWKTIKGIKQPNKRPIKTKPSSKSLEFYGIFTRPYPTSLSSARMVLVLISGNLVLGSSPQIRKPDLICKLLCMFCSDPKD